MRSAHAEVPSWVVEIGGARRRLGPGDLGCSLLDLATLSPSALMSMLEMAAAAGHGTPVDDDAPPEDDGFDEVRSWVAALRGRAASVVDIAPDLPPETRAEHSDAAAAAVRARLETALAAAELLLARIAAATQELTTAEVDRITARLDALAGPDGDGMPVSRVGTEALAPGDAVRLADLTVAVARWAFPPPRCAAALVGSDGAAAGGAVADVVGFLLGAAERLAERLDTARALIAPPEPARPAPAVATRPDAAALAAALAELVGRPGLPIGAPLAASTDLLVGGAALEDWASTISAVRADLAAPLGAGDRARPAGLELFATNPADPWRVTDLAELDRRPAAGEDAFTPPAPRLTVALAPARPIAGEELEWVVLDAFTESVPTSRPVAGVSFDAATPSARPPQAILIVPPADLDAGDPTDQEIRGAIVYARMLAHGRMAVASDLAAAGVGALAAWAVLPQDRRTGAPLSSTPLSDPVPDQPEVLVPDPDDADDIAAAVTADALWMLGQQWRLGEHAGEDAATPLKVDLTLSETPIEGTLINPSLPARTTPLDASVESEPDGATSGWQSESLHYAAELSIDGEIGLDIREHDAGGAGWWELTARTPVAAEIAPSPQQTRPSRLVWPGAPTGRYWQIEDRAHGCRGHGS